MTGWPLTAYSSGDTVEIVGVGQCELYDRLIALGFVVNRRVVIHQTKPLWICRVGRTKVALGDDIAGLIYVRRRN